MRKLAVLSIVLIVTLAVAVPASADQPFYLYEDYYDIYLPGFDCATLGYNFRITEHFVGTVSELVYQQDEEWFRTRWQQKGKVTLFNTANPEMAAEATTDFSQHVTWTGQNTWTRKYTGLFFKVVLPGGQPLHFSGQMIELVDAWTVIAVTKSVGMSKEDRAALCAGLAK